MAANVREHHPDAAADADAWETPECRAHHGTSGWVYHVATEHPAAFDEALAEVA